MKTTRNMVYFILLMFSIGWGQDCDENMYWSDCGLPFYCNPTCLNPEPLPECDDYCEIGCFCNEGYMFSDDTYSECILIEDCQDGLLCNEETEVELWGECYNIDETNVIELSNNGLTGEIPPEIGDLTNLTYLSLRSNQLTGEIPSEIGNLVNLIVLCLMDNELTGEIPSDIGNLTNLTYLYLRSNQLTGEIPSEIGNLTNLTYLTLRSNQLTGEIPSEIGNLVNLIILHLNDNNLSSEIPENICDLTINWSGGTDTIHGFPFLYFDVNNNNLCPPYPDCLINQEPFTDVNNNGIWDVGEPFEDINDSGYFDEDQIGYQDTSECIIIEGDINFDGYVNIYDIIFLVNCILTDSCDISYDINYDNEININDIVLLIDIILEL